MNNVLCQYSGAYAGLWSVIRPWMQRVHRDAIDTNPDVQPNDISHPVSKDKYRSQLLGANMLTLSVHVSAVAWIGERSVGNIPCVLSASCWVLWRTISLKRLRRPMIDKRTHNRGHFSYAGVDHGEDSRDQNKSPEQSSCTYATDDQVRVSDDYLACRDDGAAEHGHGCKFEVSFCLLLEAHLSHATLVRHSSFGVIRKTLAARRVSIFGIGVGVHL